MPSTFTTRLRLTLPATGELVNTWGTTVNTGITELVDASIAGAATLSTWGGTGVAYTLSNNNGLADEARCMFIVASGTPGEAKNIICPAVSKLYVVKNEVAGGFAVTLKTASGSGVTVPNGATMLLRCDGTNVVDAITRISSLTLASALPVASGGTGATTLTGILKGNGAGAFTAASAGTDYAPATSGTSILYGNGAGGFSNVTIGSGVTFAGGTLSATGSGGTVTSVTASAPLASSGGATPNITLTNPLPVANGGTGQTSFTDGQLLIGNTTGNTLTKATLTAGTGIGITNGAGSITISNTSSGAPALNVVTGTTQTAVAGNQYVLTNAAASTVTLPGSPVAGDVVWVTVGNGRTDNVIARNGQNIMGLAEDMTLNNQYASVQLRFVNASLGWRMV